MGKRKREKQSALRPSVFRAPVSVAAVVFVVSAALILRRYFATFPPPFTDTKLFAGVDFNAPAAKIFSHFAAISRALAVFAAAFGAGSAFLKIFRLGMSPQEKTVFSLSTGLGLVALAVFVLGHTGLLKVVPMAMVGIVFWILAVFEIRSAIKTGHPEPNAATEKKEKIGLVGYGALAVLAVAAFVNIVGALTPETFYDSQQYQLGLPAQWLLGSSIKSDVYTPSSFFPMNVNMLFTAAMAFGDDVAAKMVHYFCGILAAYAVFVFCRRRWSVGAGIFAALIFYANPATMTVSWKTAVEMGLAVFAFASFFAAMKYYDTSRRAWLALAGVLCGFAVGGKYTGLVFAWFPAVVMIFFRAASKETSLKSAAFDALFFSALAGLAAAPWLLRNAILTGNPIFPFFWTQIGFTKLRAAGQFLDPNWPPFTFVNYFLFLWPLTMNLLHPEGYPGAVFLTLLPLIFFVRSDDKHRALAAWIYLAAAIISWAATGKFYLRYFLPSLPVAAVIFAHYLSIAGMSSAVGKLAAALVIYLSAANIVFAARVLRDTQDPARYVFSDISKGDYLSTQRMSYPAPYFPAAEWINNNLPADAGIIFMGETRGLFTERKHKTSSAPDFWWYLETLGNSRNAAEYRLALKNAGMTHILFNWPEARRLLGYDVFYFDERTLEIFDDFWRAHVREIHSAAADIYAPEYGITSMRRQQPEWWARHASNPLNRIYVYAILDGPAAAALPAPPDPALMKELYPDTRWSVISKKAETLLGRSGRR